MTSRSSKQSWDEEIELNDVKSTEDQLSLLESPRSQLSLNFKILKTNNRVGSPLYSQNSINYDDSSISLSPVTKNAFFAKEQRKYSIKTIHSNMGIENDRVSSSHSGYESQSKLSDKSKYREQLRNRFFNIKQQAELSVIKNNFHKKKRLKNKQSLKSSLDEELEKQDHLIESVLNNHERKKNIDIKDKNLEKINDHDFFCKHNFAQEETSPSIIKKIDENVDCTKQTVLELLNLENLDENNVIEFTKPLILDISIFDQNLHYVISKKFKASEEKKETFELRYLEDEGLYVGDKPKIPPKILNSLEQRLSLSVNRNWFGGNGQLNIASDPRRKKLLRPFKESSSEISLFYKRSIPFQSNILENVLEVKKNKLKIRISKIKFNYHPLFSLEHFLAERIKQKTKEYNTCQFEGKHIKLEQKLTVLRQAKERIENILIEDESKITQKQKYRLEQYLKEIKEIRTELFNEYKNNRDLLKLTLKLWKYLKIVREKQKFTNTPIRLVIKKEKCSFEEEQNEWDRLIEIQTQEIYKEKQIEYKNAYEKYKLEMKTWKRKPDKEEEEKPLKPEIDFTVDSIRKMVTETFQKCCKPPGEPKIFFEIHYDQEITKEITFPREKARKSAVNRTKLIIKILHSGKEFYKTKPINLNDSFKCTLNEIFSVECYSTSPQISIIIEEKSGRTHSKEYKNFQLELPLLEIDFENAIKQQYRFNMIENITYSHTGMGTGNIIERHFLNYSLENIENIDSVYLAGTLHLYAGWDTDDIDINECTVKNKSSSIMKNNQIDPQDPLNSELIHILKRSSSAERDENCFRLYSNDDLFCTEDDIENNLRFRMLRLRSKGEMEFQGQIVPNRENEILSDVFNEFEERKKREFEEFYIDSDVNEDQINTQRQWGLQQLSQIKQKVNEICKTTEGSYTLNDVLIDNEIPDIRSLGLLLMKWFRPKRPLRPTRKTLNQIPVSALTLNSSTTDLKLVVNIVQAFLVPIRKSLIQKMPMSPNKKSGVDIFDLIPVRPVVTVTYENQTVNTTTAEGCNPTWNQELLINIQRKPNSQLKSMIHINLFDEQVIDLLEDDRFRESDIHQRRHLHWLAMLEIPISTVIENNRIEGTFEMDSPPFIMGYEKQIKNNREDIIEISPRNTLESKEMTYLNLFITVIPPINGIPVLNDTKLECHETKQIENYLREWQREYIQIFPSRSFPVLIKNASYKTCCITRFFKNLNPPEFDISDSLPLEDICARFVSLIPFTDNDLTNFNGVWLTADYLLKFQVGSIPDHAVLLQCYLMNLNVDSWFAFGYNIKFGKTAFILCKQNSNKNETNYFVFDVTTAQKYNVRDTFNPFKRIFCVINHENVWANIQNDDGLHSINYNLSKVSDWLPLFNKQITISTGSLQPNTLNYNPKIDLTLLHERIETKLKSKIMKWRRHTQTVWNRHASNIYKQLLPLLEQHKIVGRHGPIDFSEHQKLLVDIQTLINTHKIHGFSLNMPYTDLKSIINVIKQTNIYINDAPNLEFAMAVYLHQYVGGIFAVWIYISTLIRRR